MSSKLTTFQGRALANAILAAVGRAESEGREHIDLQAQLSDQLRDAISSLDQAIAEAEAESEAEAGGGGGGGGSESDE